MGDSIGEGGTGSLNFVVGRLLGWTTWNVPLGGTGYIATNNGTQPNFYGRYSDITQANPQIVVISGGINDNGYVPEISLTGCSTTDPHPVRQAPRWPATARPGLAVGMWLKGTGGKITRR